MGSEVKSKGRILGLDVGDKRIGVSVSDPLGITAQALKVINCNGAEFAEIQKIAKEYNVTSILVGLPLKLNGKKSPQTEKVKIFQKNLAKFLGLPVIAWDERLTTAEAERMLISFDVSRKKRKKVIDKIASVLILQNYMDYLAFQKEDKIDGPEVP